MTLLPTSQNPEPGPEAGLPLPPALLEELRRALRSIRYGTIELVIHDGRVVQLERREKVRFDTGLREHPPSNGKRG